jgi:hypothetical protein
MQNFRFREICREQKHFATIECIESGAPVIFNTPTKIEEQFERIAPDVINDQLRCAEGFAERNENTALKSILLKDRADTMGFTKYGLLAYEIAFLGEVKIDDFEH